MAGGRAPCCDRNKVKSGAWSPEEDARLAAFVQRHGHQNWRALPKLAGLSRCGKSCRLRWMNYLSPDVKHGNFTQEEEETIINLHNLHGNKWSTIAAELPGRTDNEIKNVFNTHLKKRLMEKAPEFHKDDKSQEAAMISNSSHSSPAGSNVSCEDQNVEKLPSDQDSATKKPRLLQSCPNNEPKEASSSNALNSSQVDAAARPSQEMNSQINSEGVKEVRNAVNEGQSQDNIDKVPFDPDLDFADWVEKNLESLPKEQPLVDSGLTLYYMSKISGDENHPHDAGQSGYFEKIMEQAMDASFLDSPPPSPSGDIFKFE